MISSKKFWLKKSQILDWDKFPTEVYLKKKLGADWYRDGKLNIYKNCITYNLKKKSKNAIITISKDKKVNYYTYKNLDKKVNLFISYLNKNFHLKKNKEFRMMIHSSSTLESAISMLACAKLGIHFSVIFEELEEEAILKRIDLFNPDCFYTRQDISHFINKYKKICKIHKSKIIFDENFKKNEKKINVVKFENKSFKSMKNFFTLFTSGSTGAPKGVTHAMGGYLVYSKFTCQEQFGMNSKSIALTASDAGWINGHTYALFGPLSCGATTILLESPMLMLNKEILKKIISLKTSILYLPVTIIRLMKTLYQNKKYVNHSIKTFGSMGEPLAPSVGDWYVKFFGKKKNSIVNTFFQTETGGIICSPKFNTSNKKFPHGSVGLPVTNKIKLNHLSKYKKNEFKISSPWPGCMKNILNGKKEWKKYWDKDGNFRLFDLATKINSNIYIHGRVDDVINIRGHRIGSEEIESVLLKLNGITECCAVSVNDEIEGSKISLFIVSKDNLNKKIEETINANFGNFALPKKIYYVNELPKTRSGKILRRLIRSIITDPNKKSYGDITTILNKNVIQDFRKKIIFYE